MNKNIKDYTHLYLGCKVEYSIRFADGTVIKQEGNFTLDYDTLFKWSKNYIVIKLILRPLKDMKDTECEFVSDAALSGKPTIYVNAEVTKYLISKHFDLFGLIEAGLAI